MVIQQFLWFHRFLIDYNMDIWTRQNHCQRLFEDPNLFAHQLVRWVHFPYGSLVFFLISSIRIPWGFAVSKCLLLFHCLNCSSLVCQHLKCISGHFCVTHIVSVVQIRRSQIGGPISHFMHLLLIIRCENFNECYYLQIQFRLFQCFSFFIISQLLLFTSSSCCPCLFSIASLSRRLHFFYSMLCSNWNLN